MAYVNQDGEQRWWWQCSSANEAGSGTKGRWPKLTAVIAVMTSDLLKRLRTVVQVLKSLKYPEISLIN